MSNTSIKKQGIYISLDALLDTRLAILFQHDEEVMKLNLSNKYLNRQIDDFKGIDKEVFDLKYKNRNKLTLKDAMVCKVVNMIRELVREMLKQAITSPFHTGPKIFLNIYPYSLLPEEEDILIRGLVHITDKLSDIEIINFSDEKLTPSYLKENLAILYMYDYNNWLDVQAENFKKLPCPEITLIAPELYFKKLPTREDLISWSEHQIDPFKATEILSAPLIGLKLYEIDLFSANIK